MNTVWYCNGILLTEMVNKMPLVAEDTISAVS